MSKNILKVPEYGHYFTVVDGVLYGAAMLTDESAELDESGDINWVEVEEMEKGEKVIEKINDFFSTKFYLDDLRPVNPEKKKINQVFWLAQ